VIRRLTKLLALVLTVSVGACAREESQDESCSQYQDAGVSCRVGGQSEHPGKTTTAVVPEANRLNEVRCGCAELDPLILTVPASQKRLFTRTHPCLDLGAVCDDESHVVQVQNSIVTDAHGAKVRALCDTNFDSLPDTPQQLLLLCSPDFNTLSTGTCQIDQVQNTCSIRLTKTLIASGDALCGGFRRRVDQCLLDNVWVARESDPAPPDLGQDCDPDEEDPKPWQTEIGESFDSTCISEQGWIDHRLGTDAWKSVQRCIERAYREMYTWAEPNPDGDKVCSLLDNCDDEPNDDQRDLDCDYQGNACDDDDDGDGVLSAEEAERGGLRFCADTDGDGILDGMERNDPGDAPTMNDEDSDLDGVPDRVEAGIASPPSFENTRCGYDGAEPGVERDCPGGIEAVSSNGGYPFPVNTDGDIFPDYLDDDSDGDGVLDGDDNCRVDFNDTQRDLDEDLLGDVCDDDRDGDGIPNDQDNCPHDYNPNQDDIDEDGRGDLCEATITIISPHGDPESGPNASNEFVYSAAEPHGILQVRAEVVISSGIEDLDGLEVAWSFTDVGGVAPTLTDDEPVSAGDFESRHSTTAQWTGLPPRYSDFGRKTARAQLLFRGEIVAESDNVAYEIFWPVFKDANLEGNARYHEANFAWNHTAAVAPWTDCVADVAADLDWQVDRGPNWFAYGIQADAQSTTTGQSLESYATAQSPAYGRDSLQDPQRLGPAGFTLSRNCEDDAVEIPPVSA